MKSGLTIACRTALRHYLHTKKQADFLILALAGPITPRR
jgi:hypothetical protein